MHLSWLGAPEAQRHREEEGSLLFLDVSGFTPLTERLAKRGKAGVEELIGTLNGVIEPLVSTAAALGGDTLKFGGDALLLLFTGAGHPERACAAARDLQVVMGRFRRLSTSAGIVTLRASAGVASGPVHTFLVGDRFKELVVAGPTTSDVMELEKLAEAGQVLVAGGTAAALDPAVLGRACGPGRLLRGRPAMAGWPPARRPSADPRAGLPAALCDHLGPEAEGEHRQVVVAFAQFRGLDELIEEGGPPAAASALHALMVSVQEACERHGVTFLATDTDLRAGKVFLATGAPTASTDDEDRMLQALREIVATPSELRLRAGVNRGRAFAVHLGAPQRRTYTTMGDTTNLAARVMGKAPDGAVLATRAVLDRVRAPFAITPVAPFAVKGKRGEIEAGVVGDLTAAPRRTVTSAALAGRDPELAVLRDALEATRQGVGRVVQLVAEPGLGKSRLVAEIGGEATAAGLRQLVVEGGPYSVYSPYFALCAPLRAAIGAERSDHDAVVAALRERVRELMPRSEPLLPLMALPFGVRMSDTPETARLATATSREQLHLLLDRLLAGLLPSGETVLVIEDAHWLDEASAELLRHLLRQAPERGWLAVLSRRPGADGLVDLPADTTTLDLAPLSPQAARSVALDEAEGALPPHTITTVVERAHGNPLFLHELVTAACSGQDVDALPESVEALLTARIDTLAVSDRRLLRRASVLGQRFPLTWLTGMLDREEAQVSADLGRLADFLEVEPDSVRFRHALQREAAYEALPFQHRQELHARAGRLIERGLGAAADQKADILSLHFLRARDHGRAWRYARAAADRAREQAAHADAAQLYRRAIEAGGALGLADAHMAEVWEARGHSHARAGEPGQAMEAFRMARRLVRGDSVAEAQLLGHHARVSSDAGHVSRAVRWLMRALRTLDGSDAAGAAACRAHLVSELATVRQRQGRADEAIALSRRAIGEAEEAGADAALAHACYTLDRALVESDRRDEAVHSERALEIFRRLGDLDQEAAVVNNLGVRAYFEGRWDDAVMLYRQASEASARAGSVANASIGDCNIGEIRSDQGRYDEAEARLRRALEIMGSTGLDWGVGFTTALLGRALVRARRHEEGESLLQEALIRFRGLRLSGDVLWVEALIPEAHLFAGNATAALTGADRLLDATAGGGRLSALLHRVRGCALGHLGPPPVAISALQTALGEARDVGDELEIALVLDALLRAAPHDRRVASGWRRERDAIVVRLDVVRLPSPPVASRTAALPLRDLAVTAG